MNFINNIFGTGYQFREYQNITNKTDFFDELNPYLPKNKRDEIIKMILNYEYFWVDNEATESKNKRKIYDNKNI